MPTSSCWARPKSPRRWTQLRIRGRVAEPAPAVHRPHARPAARERANASIQINALRASWRLLPRRSPAARDMYLDRRDTIELRGGRRGGEQQSHPMVDPWPRYERQPQHRVRRRAHAGGGRALSHQQGDRRPRHRHFSCVPVGRRQRRRQPGRSSDAPVGRPSSRMFATRMTHRPRTGDKTRVVVADRRRRLRAPGARDVRRMRRADRAPRRDRASRRAVRKLDTDGATVVIVDIDAGQRGEIRGAQRADAAARRHAAGDRRDPRLRRRPSRAAAADAGRRFRREAGRAARSGARLRARRARRRAARGSRPKHRSTPSCPPPAASA